jgi:Flp pilus assembly protein TadD
MSDQRRPMTFEEAEKYFLAKLTEPAEDHQAIRRELFVIYRTMGRAADSMLYAQEYLAHTENPEARAEAFNILGQAMEHVNDFESAVRFYMLALELNPQNKLYRYFVLNNLGYSLNQLKRFVESEVYLRKAITIDGSRSNGFKNLGLSLEGQEKFVEAAESYLNAIRANAGDSRPLQHLEELVEHHKELLVEEPELKLRLQECRLAVALAKDMLHRKN